jgi:hypothetical protein
MLAVTRSLPQPCSSDLNRLLISTDISGGSEIKYQPPGDGCRHGIPTKWYFIFPSGIVK